MIYLDFYDNGWVNNRAVLSGVQ